MKKLFSLLLALCLVLGVCGGALAAAAPEATPIPEPEPEPAPEPEAAPREYRIIAWEPEAYGPVQPAEGEDEPGEGEEPAGSVALYTGEDYGSSLGDVTVPAGLVWSVEDSCVVDRLEIAEGAEVEADFPVIVFFSESDSVQNGEVRGNVQFVSDYDEVIAIVHTNDTHGFLDSEPYVKGLSDQLKASGQYSLVLTVSGGDLFAGGYAAAHVYEGEYIPYVMGGIYDFLTWGNNDAGITDRGIGTYFLSILGNESGVTALLANQDASEEMDMAAYARDYEPAVGNEEFADLYDAVALDEDGALDFSAIDLDSYALAAGDNALDDGALIETEAGTVLGIFGESTQGGSITDAYFAGGQSTVEVAQGMADALRDEGASVVVMLCHTGWMGADSTDASSNDTNTALVAKDTTGIDAIVDGHTHSVINDGEGWLFADSPSRTIVNQANCKGEAVGVMYLYLKDGQVVAKDCENITPDDETGEYPGIIPDSGIEAKVARVYDRLAADGYTAAHATSEYFLNGERIDTGDPGGGVRANETNLGDLVADGILWVAQQRWEGEPISIALYPGFWVRSSVQAGNITLVDALSVFANPLKIYYAEYTAAELVQEMTTSCSKLGQENNFMYQVAGLRCTYDPETFEVTTLTVGDELIYDHGEYLVGEDWTVGCAAEVGGGNMEIPDGTEIVASNAEMAELWCRFLDSGAYTIYPDEIAPAGRVVPEAAE